MQVVLRRDVVCNSKMLRIFFQPCWKPSVLLKMPFLAWLELLRQGLLAGHQPGHHANWRDPL